MILTILPCKRHKNEEAWQIRHAFPACHKNVSVSIRQGMLHDILAFLRRNAHMSVRGGRHANHIYVLRIRNAYHGRTYVSARRRHSAFPTHLPRADTWVRPYGGTGERAKLSILCVLRREGPPSTAGVVHATSYPLSVGADLCVRPAETQCVSHPFTANSQCLPRADTWVCPYGGTGRC